ncbi:MAG TPA: alpha/beta hydrolase [Steroidobacteraceae bacterium]|nr:alpha/beta hydrolase [Steroidobacteraceae bacterium]
MKWIALFALAAVVVFASGCTSLSFLIANTASWTGRYDRSTSHAYGPESRQKLDIYMPKDARDRPVVVFFYGGSWTAGSRGLYRFVGAALAERGFVTVVPDYRLYPQAKFPVFVDDGALALAWVQKHAQEFGGDPHRIVLMGHSAGGHEAAFLAYDRALLEKAGAHPEWIVGLVGLSGPYALEPNSDILNTIFASPYTEADWQPVRFVTPQSPPTLLVHGTADDVVSIKHAEKLRDVLQANHVRVETQFYPGKGHADTIAGISVPARKRTPVLDQSVAFIESVTAAQRP